MRTEGSISRGFCCYPERNKPGSMMHLADHTQRSWLRQEAKGVKNCCTNLGVEDRQISAEGRLVQ